MGHRWGIGLVLIMVYAHRECGIGRGRRAGGCGEEHGATLFMLTAGQVAPTGCGMAGIAFCSIYVRGGVLLAPG